MRSFLPSRPLPAPMPTIAVAGLALLLAGCGAPAPEPTASAEATESAQAGPTDAATTDAAPVATAAASDELTIAGLGALRIGLPVPAGSGWTADGEQASDTCITYGSAAFPGIYAIVEDGAVRRISAGEGAAVALPGGLAVGAAEAEVQRQYPGLRSDPHTYEEPPAHYLTAPGATATRASLRFEIGADRKVQWIHVGTEPTLEYIEGCA